MNKKKRITAGILIPVAMVFALSANSCDSTPRQAYKQRQEQQLDTNKTASKPTDTLEQANLRRRLAIQEKANQIGYVYVFTMDREPIGYYVIKGKVSSSGSQLAPENEVIKGYNGDGYIADSAQDDNTYGEGDEGVFFFLADGTMIETDLWYVYSTNPIPLKVPKLGG